MRFELAQITCRHLPGKLDVQRGQGFRRFAFGCDFGGLPVFEVFRELLPARKDAGAKCRVGLQPTVKRRLCQCVTVPTGSRHQAARGTRDQQLLLNLRTDMLRNGGACITAGAKLVIQCLVFPDNGFIHCCAVQTGSQPVCVIVAHHGVEFFADDRLCQCAGECLKTVPVSKPLARLAVFGGRLSRAFLAQQVCARTIGRNAQHRGRFRSREVRRTESLPFGRALRQLYDVHHSTLRRFAAHLADARSLFHA